MKSVLLALVLTAAVVTATSPTDKVKHVVVLMLENRSFDHFMGFLKRNNSAIDGCLPDDDRCWNSLTPGDANATKYYVGDGAVYVQPADPNHSIHNTARQLYGLEAPDTHDRATPNMSGFAMDYASVTKDAKVGGEFIMQCFAPEHLPVSSTLALEFAVFNDWHAAIPGPTMVNRAYADSATSHGEGTNKYLDIALGYPQRTIYEDLDAAGVSWRDYFELVPTSWQFASTRKHLFDGSYRWYKDFAADVAKGDMASYTFLDPAYYGVGKYPARDMHPNHDVSLGEEMIKEVYEALRAGPKWNETLLLITFDEHGGFFDHVVPPSCPNPDGLNDTDAGENFDFTRLGLRVPTIAVSPWTAKGTVVQSSNADPEATSNVRFEHSSIPKTLHALFAPDAEPLTKREVFASTFHEEVLNSPTLRTDCPMTLPAAVPHSELTPGLPAIGKAPVTGLQRELAAMAAGVAGLLEEDVTSLTAEEDEGVMGAKVLSLVQRALAGKEE